MFKIFKKDKTDKSQQQPASETTNMPLAADEALSVLTDSAENKQGFFSRLKQGLTKTRTNFTAGLGNLVLGKKQIDDELLDDIETQLLMADVGVNTTEKVIKQLTENIKRNQLSDPNALILVLKQVLSDILSPVSKPLILTEETPFVILVVGTNGSGKTTTIGKLAKQFQSEGKKVMLAAGDTFRAAAIEQLQIWGERNDVRVVASQSGGDSAAVIYDAMQSAGAKNSDVLLADTAGRLHTQDHLMQELKKVRRVIKKSSETAPHETLLILDASIGQNALVQAKKFTEAVQVSGIALTKLDGTAKGGIIFAIADELGVRFRYIGVGEGIDDLRPFNAEAFVEALFND